MRARWAALAALSLAIPCTARGDSMRCDGGIVAEGDSKVDLIGKCGRPTLREVLEDAHGAYWLDPRTIAPDGTRRGEVGSVSAADEIWTYDFGPSRFMMRATIRQGKVARLESGERGYGAPGTDSRGVPVSRCDPARLHVGDGKLDVLAKCGEPASTDGWREIRGVGALDADAGAAFAATATVFHEIWTYNFGPDRFLRLVHLENGIVTAIETGGYGYRE
jgi:hypothetical protein